MAMLAMRLLLLLLLLLLLCDPLRLQLLEARRVVLLQLDLREQMILHGIQAEINASLRMHTPKLRRTYTNTS